MGLVWFGLMVASFSVVGVGGVMVFLVAVDRETGRKERRGKREKE